LHHKKKREINYILENGVKIRSSYGSFFLCSKRKAEFIHAAVLIKKSVGNAVLRNYCKRIVREYIRNRRFFFRKFNNFIFIYTNSGPVSYGKLAEDLDRCLNNNIERLE